MKAILQRVHTAGVSVDSNEISRIENGWLILLGVKEGDTEEDARFLAKKTLNLRCFNDAEGKMNLNVQQVGGSLLVVSQFTLYANCEKGLRPSFVKAARPETAQKLYEFFVSLLKKSGLKVETGSFGAKMTVHMDGDGPVTIPLEF